MKSWKRNIRKLVQCGNINSFKYALSVWYTLLYSPKMVIIFTILPLQSRHLCNSESVMHLCILSKSICNNHFYLYIFISHEKCQFMLNSTLFWAILRLFLMCIYIKIYLFPFCWTYFGADCEGPLGYDRLRLWQLFVFTATGPKQCTNINSYRFLENLSCLFS